MINFIIVEDIKKDQDNIKSIINKVMTEKNISYDISIHISRTKPLEKIIETTNGRKIYILDIQLKDNESGINIAKDIRTNDWESEIIFITNHDKMFESVYRNIYKVFDFIEKFHDFDNRLAKDIREIVDTKFDNGLFKYHANNIDLFIHFKEIQYIYRDKSSRKIVIVTNNNKFKINLGVQEMLNYLDDRFMQVHRACIVNLNYINEFNWSEGYFTLSTGEKVYLLAKKHKKDIANI